MTETDTKTRILDAAERLFAQKGFAGTSLRAVTGAAGVNLASVHYHFGSKDGLVQAIVHRLVDPMNEERLQMLAALEDRYGSRPIPLPKLVVAFLEPIIRLASQSPRGDVFANLIGRLMSEPDYFFGRIAPGQFAKLRTPFVEAFRRTLPKVPPEEIFWRLMLGIGTVAHAMRMSAHVSQLSDGLCGPPTPEETIQRLKNFVTAGMKSPHTEVSR
jgi:AcrR family transcriptional regulator